MFDFLRVTGLFFVTAVAEIVGCWLVWLWLRQRTQRQATPQTA